MLWPMKMIFSLKGSISVARYPGVVLYMRNQCSSFPSYSLNQISQQGANLMPFFSKNRFSKLFIATSSCNRKSTNLRALAPDSTYSTTLQKVAKSLNDILLKPRSFILTRWISPQHYSFTLSEIFGHSSFILVAASYATDDFLQLRIMAVLGAGCMSIFTYFHPHGRVLWLPWKWNMLFIIINSYRIGKIMWDRYMADKMSPKLKKFREDYLNVLDLVDFYKLMSIAEEEIFEEGGMVIKQGCPNPYIRIVLEGELEVLRDGTLTYILEEGNFISEAGLHAGLLLTGDVESCASIKVGMKFQNTGHKTTDNFDSNLDKDQRQTQKNTVRTIRWKRDDLIALIRDDKAIRNSLKAALSWDIVRKLKMQRHMLTEGRVQDAQAWTRKREDQGISRYASILQNMLHHPEEAANMNELLMIYRKIHQIDDRDHKQALLKCGWTEEEFRAGIKQNADKDAILDINF